LLDEKNIKKVNKNTRISKVIVNIRKSFCLFDFLTQVRSAIAKKKKKVARGVKKRNRSQIFF